MRCRDLILSLLIASLLVSSGLASRRRRSFGDPLAGVDVSTICDSGLEQQEQDRWASAMQSLVGGEKLWDYIARVTPHEPPQRHFDPVIDVLEYSRLKPVRIVFDMAPGHAKTTLLMKSIAWWLDPRQSPGDLCAYVTHSAEQARTKSRIAKETYLVGTGAELHEDKTADGFWLTPQGGGLRALGSRGGLTGSRVPGLLVYDDPYKDMQEARSHAINSMIIERFRGVAYTRLQGGSIIVLHTRWHVDDLIGFIVKEFIRKNLGWDQISIPAICESPETDVLERRGTSKDPITGQDIVGEVAWPEKYPYEICADEHGDPVMCGHDGHLKELRLTLGELMFCAMYQGQPRPEGTLVFREPARYRLRDGVDRHTGQVVRSEFSWTGKRGVIAIDPAATESTAADWSALVVMASEGYGIRTRIWIVDVIRVQVDIPTLVKMAKRLQQQYPLMVACEAIAGFKSVPQSLRAIDPGLRVLDVTTGGKDKFTRAQPLAGAWNDGRVLVPIDAQWAEPFIYEFCRFTGVNDAHDDQVDAGAHGFNILYRPAPRITESDYAAGGI